MPECTWEEIMQQHNLVHTAFKSVATWAFGDWVFSEESDWFSDVSKLRRAGFQRMNIDTTSMFLQQFAQLRQDRIIP